jgi:hypothetical protein
VVREVRDDAEMDELVQVSSLHSFSDRMNFKIMNFKIIPHLSRAFGTFTGHQQTPPTTSPNRVAFT